MSRKSRRLDLVQRVFEKREQEHAKKLGAFQAQLDEALGILKQLRNYRDQSTATNHANMTTNPGRLLNQQAFQNRLSEAINQQELLIQRATHERDELRRHWLEQRCRTESVDKLRSNRNLQEQQEETQREQKLLDEISSRTFNRLV